MHWWTTTQSSVYTGSTITEISGRETLPILNIHKQSLLVERSCERVRVPFCRYNAGVGADVDDGHAVAAVQ